MNTLIVYSSKYGCTEKCAKLIKEKLNEEVDLVNLKNVKDIDIYKYNKVIIGGSIYIGKIQKSVTEFCTKYIDQLVEKKVGLFICGMQDNEVMNTELNQNYPKKLLEIAKSKEWLGGEFLLDKMSFMDKLIVKKVSKVTSNKSNILEDKINRFVQIMKL